MLEIARLQHRVGNVQLDVSLQAEPNRVHAVLGRSGCGKTTLLNLIAGFNSPDAGDIRWQGHSMLPLSPADRPVTTLFQQHNLFAHLTVAENMGLGIHPGLKLSRPEWDQVHATLASLNLAGFADKAVRTLSGGEQQRVALGRCLLRNKPVLLLDEPFSALDADTRDDMRALVRDLLNDRELCILLVTHDHEDAIQLNAKCYAMEHGALTELSHPDGN